MELLIWSVIFIVSLVALLKAAGWFGAAAARIFGLAANSRFAAAPIAAALPELALSLAAVLAGRPELAAAIVIGSSIANILLVVGLSAVAAKSLPVKREQIDLDAPLLVAALAIFYFAARDGEVVFWEGALMAAAFLACAFFVLFRGRPREFTPRDIIEPGFLAAGRNIVEIVGVRFSRGLESFSGKSFGAAVFLALAAAALLALAANFAIGSLDNIAAIIKRPGAALAMAALALASALPELLSSLEIIRKRRYEMMLGNVFASTTVNLLLVCGISALFSPLPLGREVLNIGLPFFAAAAGLLTVSAFSRKINNGQGMMFLFLYFLFLAKVFNLF